MNKPHILSDKALLTKEELTAINDAMPSEAKYGEVFVAIRTAQHRKTLERVIKWGNQTCVEHEVKGILRRECPQCWADLSKEVEG
jgi:hypothetical protein